VFERLFGGGDGLPPVAGKVERAREVGGRRVGPTTRKSGDDAVM